MLRIGVACDAFVGIERLVFYHFSNVVRKGHELIALVSFLSFAQRGVGRADYDWHGHGTPLWLSFAWWQWLAAGLLWLSIGHLLLTARSSRNPPSPP